ncbi:MAG: CRISPR-associated endonuclease Cas6 [Bacteroidota bacterium]
MHQTTITFPQIGLSTRDAHKLRGYFGNLFKERSPLLHNHLEGGNGFRQQYPLVQYKVIDGVPMLVGFQEGAKLLMELFLEMKEIWIDGLLLPVHQKNIQCKEQIVGYMPTDMAYQFKTLWMPLNQRNYPQWRDGNEEERNALLQRLLVNQTVASLRGVDRGPTPEQRLACKLRVEGRKTNFKNQKMQAFKGSFTINAQLPDYFAIGKSVSRGFGTIIRK